MLAGSSIILPLCNPLWSGLGSHHSRNTALVKAPWSTLLTSRVRLCPRFLRMDHFLLLEAVGVQAPHPWFFSCLIWNFLSILCWCVLIAPTSKCWMFQGLVFRLFFLHVSSLWFYSVSTLMCLRFIFPTRTSSLNASLPYATTFSTAHRHLKRRLPPNLSWAAIAMVLITSVSHLINCSSFLTSLPVSTLVPLWSILEMVVRMTLFMHIDHILPMLKAPTFLYFRGKAQVLMLAAKASRSLAPSLSPGSLSLHLPCFLSVSHQSDPLPPQDPCACVPFLLRVVFLQIFVTLSSLSSLLRYQIMCEVSTGHST